MSNSLTLSVPSFVVALVGKKGNISKKAQKAADTLNGASASVLLAASLSKGDLQATAANTLKRMVPTVSTMLSGDTIENWGDLLTLLANKFGLDNLNRDKASPYYMKGRSGVLLYVQLCIDSANVSVARAESDKARDKATTLQSELAAVVASVNRLSQAHENARMQADIDKALLDSGISADTVPADTVPADTESEFLVTY